MCGIAGFFSKQVTDVHQTMERMLLRTQSRGPDDRGIWSEQGVTLGHMRLSILDLSPAGHQPMISPSGRYVMTYNGEVYNHLNLRKMLPSDTQYKGHSDTETLLHFMDHFGLDWTLQHIVGMFAWAIFDRNTQQLQLVRDPIGIKPLYYGFVGTDLLFASQIKAFSPYPGFERNISQEALNLYWKYNYIPAPYAIYEHCHKQKPGTVLTFEEGKLVNERVYWSLEKAYNKGNQNPVTSLHEACEQTEDTIKTAVKRQLVADVPVGVFLSGGVDSSLIAGMAARAASGIKTFSIGFHEERYNEAVYAAKVARHLGTDHTEEYMSIETTLNIIPNIPEIADEPFGDASQLPTLLLCQLAKKHVKVVLSGDGGDELFGGYQRYADLQKFRAIQKYIPSFLSPLAGCALEKMSRRKILSDQWNFKFHMAARSMRHADIESQYDGLFQFWPSAGGVQPKKPHNMSDVDYMTYHDMHMYLPDDILMKVDRCSMHVSLEARVPFLDQPMLEQSLRIPSHFKVGERGLKTVLKKILDRHVPQHLTERSKQGFSLPIDEWLRGPLKAWAMDLWEQVMKDVPVNRALLERRMDEHQKGICNWQYSIWNMLMWQQWRMG